MFSFFFGHSGSSDKKQLEFSKSLLVQESALIWIHTIAMIVLAYICVFRSYFAELPWLTAMVALPWTAYSVSQHAYYKKAQAENTKDGIRYESVMADYYDDMGICDDEDMLPKG